MITYFEVLLIFIVPPILFLGLVTRQRADMIKINSLDYKMIIFILSVVAFIYTTPWDNYLVANGVWFYDEGLISGIVFYWVPLEEYLFFILETILVSLIFLNLHTQSIPRQIGSNNFRTNKKSHRLFGFLLLTFVWLITVFLLLFGPTEFTYLSLILTWALIPIAIQFVYGGDIILENKTSVSLTILISTTYLSLVDAFAIYSGTWTIASEYSLTSYKVGIMPFEEILFFFVTSVLVTFGILLGTEYKSRMRFLQFVESVRQTC